MQNPKKFVQAFIALGSNLEDPTIQIQQAFNELNKLPNTRLIKRSSLYKTAPMGRVDQPDFINAVAQIETSETPHDLLSALLAIEHQHKRVRHEINAPRTLDLDILMYDDLQCRDTGLTLPHPRISQRAFVLQPLVEICPDCSIPGLGNAINLLASCIDQRVEKMPTNEC